MQKIKKNIALKMIAVVFLLNILIGIAPVNYASAVIIPKLTMVTQPAKEYKPGDRISFTVTSPNYKGKVEYRVILYNGTTKKTSELWKTPATGYYYKSWQPSGNYKFPISWPAIGMEPGAYSLTVLVRRVGAKVPYDSYVKTSSFWIRNPGFPALSGSSAAQNNYGSTMAKHGDWVYYYDYIDKGLDMIKYDGTGKKKIASGPVKYVTISDGWVYYVTTESSRDRIRKVRLDGTGVTELFKSASDGWNVTNIQVANNRVYYIYNGGIEYTDLNGANRTYLHTGTSANTMIIHDGYIYFSIANEAHLKRFDLEGKGMTRVVNGPVYYFAFDGNLLYFVNEKDGRSLYSASMGYETYPLPYEERDYNDEQGIANQVVEKIAAVPMMTFIIKDGWAYYNSADDYSIHRIKLDGTGDKKLTPGAAGLDDIIGDWIFCRYSYVQYRVKTDGTGYQKMFN